MPTNQQHYADLVARAVFDLSAYKGTWQDQSKSRFAMQPNNAPGWTRINGLPMVRMPATANYPYSVLQPAQIVDVTGTFFVEWLCIYRGGTGYHRPVGQQAADGGFASGPYLTNGYVGLQLFRAGGAWAVELYTANGVARYQTAIHAVLESTNGGASGKCWVRGVRVNLNRAFAGAAVNSAAAYIRCGGTDGSAYGDMLIARVWVGAVENEDASCLYQQARELTGGEV